MLCLVRQKRSHILSAAIIAGQSALLFTSAAVLQIAQQLVIRKNLMIHKNSTSEKRYRYYLVVDLEATCCDKQSIPRDEMETIEIGAVLADGNTLAVVDEFCTFIKPVRHPILTSFCTDLTTITQSDVDNAPRYPRAIQDFQQWLENYQHFLFSSWGNYDKTQLQRDSQYHRLPFPISAPHMNIKREFSRKQGLRKACGMSKALALCGLQLSGTLHRGIDDARNMVQLLPYIFGDARINI